MKPIIKDGLYCGLLLEGEGADSSRIESIATEEGFRKQTERHVTILGGQAQIILKGILDKLSDEEGVEILEKIKSLLESLEWKYKQKEIYKIRKQGYFDDPNILENRQSYICMIDMPDMDVFYKELNSLLKTDIPVQVPHITLFTKGERENSKWYGIPIPSIEEFNKLEPVSIS